MTYRKKLIEVALPLEEINKQSAREKSIRHGHPSTLHLWWARRPLAACRAVLFASLVDDPGEYIPKEQAAHDERERLFRLIEKLVNWDNLNDEKLFAEARLEIARSVARNLGVEVPVGDAAIREFLATKAPPVLDPFAGGGSIPLEAQRLGLRAYASDLNPVAVLINKALIEIPPRFANRPPVHPPEDGQAQMMKEWRGAQGLAEDVRYYGQWMRDEAEKRIGHLYPKAKLPKEYGGGEATVIAWLWARTVKCPNPACGARMPMVRSFWLSKKKDRTVYAEPIIDKEAKSLHFEIRKQGAPQKETTNRHEARCLFCDTRIKKPQLRDIATIHGVHEIPLAMVCESQKGRIYLSFQLSDIPTVERPHVFALENPITNDRRWFSPPLYGLPNFADLFTARQLITLETFSDLVNEAREQVLYDATRYGLKADGMGLNADGSSATAYAEAVAVYLSMGVSRIANTLCTIARWTASRDQTVTAFARHAIPMTWDYPEVNPFAGAAGDISISLQSICRVLETLGSEPVGHVMQHDVTSPINSVSSPVVTSDPPYYDNIDYADLSDFFYLWLRRSLGKIYPGIFSTVLVPKTQELIAASHRFEGNSKMAAEFFEQGLGLAFRNIRSAQNTNYPFAVFYAFKQAEVDEGDDYDGEVEGTTVTSTGWETMLEGLLTAGFSITGTWPMRSELSNRPVASSANALASSIVLICRPRPVDSPTATRREFITALKRELPLALKELQQGYIAPVDLAQAAIGPGMAVFSRYSQVLDADGSPMRVRAALALINQTLDEFLTEQEGEFDADTRWALAWFEQFGHNEGPFGDAETLSKAKNTSVNGLVHAGILEARAGRVRLLRREELPPSPARGRGAGGEGVWEATQYLIRALDEGGEQAAADLLRRLGALGETARDLAYRLYSICERKGWASEALAYNMLAAAWPRLTELAARSTARQDTLL